MRPMDRPSARFAAIAGWMCAPLALLLLLAELVLSGSWLGTALWVFASAAAIVAMRTRRRQRAFVLRSLVAATGLVVCVMMATLLFGDVVVVRDPLEDSSRLDTLTAWEPEREIALAGEWAVRIDGRVRPEETDGLKEAMSAAYGRMERDDGAVPSFALGTLLSQREAMIVVQPDELNPEVGVVFLHGYGGNWTVNCWQMAQAAQEIGAVTVCPSLDRPARWASRKGQSRLQQAIAWLHARGVARIYLAGLSAGAIGAGQLARPFAPDLAGVVLISGARGRPPRGMPVLVVFGTEDTMTAPRTGRLYALGAGSRGRYVGLPGDHFLFLESHEQVRAIVATWLIESEGKWNRDR